MSGPMRRHFVSAMRAPLTWQRSATYTAMVTACMHALDTHVKSLLLLYTKLASSAARTASSIQLITTECTRLIIGDSDAREGGRRCSRGGKAMLAKGVGDAREGGRRCSRGATSGATVRTLYRHLRCWSPLERLRFVLGSGDYKSSLYTYTSSSAAKNSCIIDIRISFSPPHLIKTATARNLALRYR